MSHLKLPEVDNFEGGKLLDKRKREAESAPPSAPHSPRPANSNGNNHEAKKPRIDGIVTLEDLSCPPSREELAQYVDLPINHLPKKYKRDMHCRVFVNRNVSLNKIKFFGFDMDYTIAVYKTEYEALGYDLIRDRLVEMGYPSEVGKFKYNPEFPIRGLFYDNHLGNLIKVDSFGNILVCVHGKERYDSERIRDVYPNKFVQGDEIGKRYYVLNTCFNLPETCMYADLVHFFDNHPSFTATPTGVFSEDLQLSYQNIFQDVRSAVDYVHIKGELKERTLKSLATFIEKDPALPTLLERIRASGRQVFLVTNSEYLYTRAVLTFLLGEQWKSFFDYIIVDGNKPLFFSCGTALKEVDEATGSLRIGSVHGGFQKGKIYSGGSSEIFCKLTGASGKDILYIGDHIYGDILKSKKEHGWKTFLVVPELKEEVNKMKVSRRAHQHLTNLEFILAETFRGLASECQEMPDISDLKKKIMDTVESIDITYNEHFGSTFRSGSRQTFFAMQTKRYADLYAPNILNLLYYP
eukprot:Colp12_sorted_trinity150504_noHs@7550